jgi:transposase
MSSVHRNVIKHKIGLATELGNVSRACKVMGFSRDTFYRYQAAVETDGVEALIDANRRKPNIKNRVEEETEAAVTAFALEQSAFGQVRVSNELRKRGIFVSPSGVRSVWLRQNLESFKKRLSALEKHVAETGAVLTEAQVQALEKKRTMMLPTARSRRLTPAILVARIPFTSAPSRAWGEFISKPSSTLIPNGR